MNLQQRKAAIAEDPLFDDLRALPAPLLFQYYIRERYRVRAKRLSGAAPSAWTNDLILQTYKFTNVRREWDYTSTWLCQRWYKPFGHRHTAGLAAAVARFFCYVPTLERIGFPDVPNTRKGVTRYVERTRKILQARVDGGHKIFTSAYVIGGVQRGHAKHDWVLDQYMLPAWESGLLDAEYWSCEKLHDQLVQLNGWGHFMTQEVVLDLQHTRVLQHAEDRTTYGYAGPGAIRGLNRIHGRDVGASLAQPKARAEMRALQQESTRWATMPRELRGALTVHDIEFNLCEYDKYCRVLFGQGTPKQHFTGPDADKWAAIKPADDDE